MDPVGKELRSTYQNILMKCQKCNVQHWEVCKLIFFQTVIIMGQCKGRLQILVCPQCLLLFNFFKFKQSPLFTILKSMLLILIECFSSHNTLLHKDTCQAFLFFLKRKFIKNSKRKIKEKVIKFILLQCTIRWFLVYS